MENKANMRILPENEVWCYSNSHNDDKLAQEEQKIDNIIQHNHSNNVPHQKGKCILGRNTEIGTFYGAHDVGISIDEFHKLFQTPQAAFAQANCTSHYWELFKYYVTIIEWHVRGIIWSLVI